MLNIYLYKVKNGKVDNMVYLPGVHDIKIIQGDLMGIVNEIHYEVAYMTNNGEWMLYPEVASEIGEIEGPWDALGVDVDIIGDWISNLKGITVKPDTRGNPHYGYGVS